MDAFFSLGPNPSAHQGGLGESQCLPNRETRQRGMKVGLASRTLGLGKGWRVLGAPPQSCRAEGTGQPRRRLTLHATVCHSARVHGGWREWRRPSFTAGDAGGPGRGRPRVEGPAPRTGVPEASRHAPQAGVSSSGRELEKDGGADNR
uniref:Uncharacterized protein n=1 Tax=Rousettus aegyptiacus TaxID=9407 RepID=A0A7J8IKY5_ROUAE|nr:hypothetical protein HJG63_010481 [Rousettus aegyptiacus]